MDWIIPDWPTPAEVKAVTTIRNGGVSSGAYTSMNLADHVGDEATRVANNRRIIQQQFALPSGPAWLRQVHGTRVVQAEQAAPAEQADASYSGRKGIVCAVLTADCLPVLLYDRRFRHVAALHAGWKGLAEGIIEKTVNAIAAAEWIAWLGPAIGPDAFEVGAEVRAAFLSRSDRMAGAFSPQGTHKWRADIYEIARIILCSQGVRHIYGGAFCTYSEQQRFFSYRRDGVTGRMATLIWRE